MKHWITSCEEEETLDRRREWRAGRRASGISDSHNGLWVPSLTSAFQIAGGDPEKTPETQGKGEVSISERKWGKPPHLSVLSELEPTVRVVFSRCRETVSSPPPLFPLRWPKRGTGPPGGRARLRGLTGLGRAESGLFRPAPRPRPRWRPCPEACAAGTASCQHDCVGICLGSGAAVIPAGPRKCRWGGRARPDPCPSVGLRGPRFRVLRRTAPGACLSRLGKDALAGTGFYGPGLGCRCLLPPLPSTALMTPRVGQWESWVYLRKGELGVPRPRLSGSLKNCGGTRRGGGEAS